MPEVGTSAIQRVSHVIFDLDGTLIDSETLYVKAFQHVLDTYGHTFSVDLKLRCMGRSSLSGARQVIDEFRLPLKDYEFVRRFNLEVDRLMANVKLMPGVQELLLHFHDYRVPMAIATSSSYDSFKLKTRPHCRLMPVFHHCVCGDDPELRIGKPAPDIFLLAASRFHGRPKPGCCLVFEDSPSGLQGGVAAGMQVVMIPDKLVPRERRKNATLVLRSMEEFKPELFGLPPYDNCRPKFTFG